MKPDFSKKTHKNLQQSSTASTHALTETIPHHLTPYITTQDSSLYTAMDHACWRFILKISKSFLTTNAHQKYLDGLKETGISIDHIPLIADMDQLLRKFNWRAVPVSGFIPPAVFMEFLSLGVLPIACDMRQSNHLAYTPAPDIVHEAAGHAPIIADLEYSNYLRSYGEISRKAIYSNQDLAIYEAIRALSDIKEDPHSTAHDIHKAQEHLDLANAAQTDVSEAAYLSRMGWWTFEYGLIGSLKHPKIFGAGLLSSVSESYHCFEPTVKKLPFSIDCIEMSFDITRPQPQLFVTPDFHTLTLTLEELANRMAFKKGGLESLHKAKKARTVTTVELNTGVQVSGVLIETFETNGLPEFIRFTGPTQISFQDEELPGQGLDDHAQGYSSPIESITHADLKQAGLSLNQFGTFHFKSGLILTGTLTQILEKNGHIILLTFWGCTLKQGNKILFQPEWGNYDLVCGSRVTSVFGGLADRSKTPPPKISPNYGKSGQKSNLTAANRDLNALYESFDAIRTHSSSNQRAQIQKLTTLLDNKFTQEWLLRYQVLEWECAQNQHSDLAKRLREQLKQIAKSSPEKKELIQRGLQAIQSS